MREQAIENYGIIGNMRSAALVSITGAIDFFCFPAFDSPSIFAALLDEEKGGTFHIEPQIDNLRTKQLYLPDTNILLTRFLSSTGVAELTDFMPVSETEGHNYAHQLIRTVRVIRGEVRFRLLCAPRFDYARASHTASRHGDSICFHPQAPACPEMILQATIPLHIHKNDATAEFTLCAGQSASFALGSLVANEERYQQTELDAQSIETQFNGTTKYWRDWMHQSKYQGRWREVVNRSALALKLLTSREHGSILAAATFGLPEQPGGARNWDYRFTWLRDSSFTLYAFMRLGFTGEAREFTHWLRDRITLSLKQDAVPDKQDGPLRVIYRLDGTDHLDETSLSHLAGFRNSQPVRIGNAAATQMQLDIYGELMDAIYLSNKYGNAISYDGWGRLRQVLAWLADNWNRPDEGIWEVRNGRQHFLHSRLMCWVAFDRAIRLAQKRSLVAPLADWFSTRDAIHEDIFAHFWSDSLQSFVQSKGSETLDAATLLMPLLRFISPTDPRWLSTMAAIEQHLTEDALVYRYTNGSDDGQSTDGLDGTEGSFIACSFWRIECLARQGEVDRARLLFDKMLAYANHLGLYAEELGPSGEQLGNFPQALTHLALISAATYLDRKLSNDRNETWE
jgi:GH15 family glucan-1,4-alpha-glucosidase